MKVYLKEYKNYTIRTCDLSDIQYMMKFIDKWWAKGHILSVSKKLIDWQYYNQRWDRYNFIYAIDNKNNQILGIIGYIPTYIFDINIDNDDKYIWLSVWKVRDDYIKTAMGIQLLSAIFELENTKNVGTVGINQNVEPLYRMMKFNTGILDHFYIVNSSKQTYKLICGNVKTHHHTINKNIRLHLLNNENELPEFCSKLLNREINFPIKTVNYIINRYLKHPFYKYKIFGIETNNVKTALLICRTAHAIGASAIRIIDIQGTFSEMSGSYGAFQELLRQSGAEYIDLYCHGLNNEHIIAAGFTLKTPENDIIIPNYYEPFTQSNVDIRYAYHTAVKNHYIIFKGDGDQDRPNHITWEE